MRKNLTTKVFKTLDYKGTGEILIDDLKDMYNADRHPDVLIRRKTKEEVLTEFLDTFEDYCNFVVHLIIILGKRL